MGTMVALALTLPVEWGLLDRVLMVGIGLLVVGGLYALARPRLIAQENRVLVINGIRTHVLSWAEIIDIQMPVGEPWPCVDLSDGTSLPVMGIQSTDGERAHKNIAEFRKMVRERGEAEEPGRSEEHTSELQSRGHLVCRLLLEKKKQTKEIPVRQNKKHSYTKVTQHNT